MARRKNSRIRREFRRYVCPVPGCGKKMKAVSVREFEKNDKSGMQRPTGYGLCDDHGFQIAETVVPA